MEAVAIVFTSLLVLVIYYIYKKIREPFDTIRSWGVKTISCYPVLGNFTWNQGPWDCDVYQRYKNERIIGLQGFRTPFMFVLDKDLIKRVLVKDFHAFTDRHLLAISPPPLNKSVFSLSKEHWKHVRGLVSPTLTTGKLKAMSGLIDRAAQNATDFLDNRKDSNQPVKAKEFFTRFTIDAVAYTLFGLDMNSHLDQNHPFVLHALDSFNVTLSNPWLLLSLLVPELMHVWTKFGCFLMRVKAMDYYRKIVLEIIQHRKEHPEDIRHDFMNTIASSEVAEEDCDKVTVHALGHVGRWSENGLTRDEIISQGVAFMAAGFETTATTLQMLAYCLATHPSIQEKVREEISQVLGDHHTVTYDDLNSFPYLDMCINETLRMYPPANRTERRCNQTINLDGILVPEGTFITIPLYALGMDPEEFPNPEIFDPNRFTNEKKAERHSYSYMPFGAGPRNCLGMRLAWQEMRLLIARLLQKYTIEPSSDTKMPDELNFEYTGFLKVNDPINLRLIPLQTFY